MSYLNQLIGFVSLHAELAYVAIFLAAFLEAIPILGTLVPGSTVILALSALIPAGSLGPHTGAGRRHCRRGDRRSSRLLDRLHQPARSPDIVADVEIPGGYGAKRRVLSPLRTFAVFFARFVPPVRAVVPVIAGALGMPPRRFYPASIAACLLWAPAHVLPGLLAGSAAERWGAKVEHYGLPLVGGHHRHRDDRGGRSLLAQPAQRGCAGRAALQLAESFNEAARAQDARTTVLR